MNSMSKSRIVVAEVLTILEITAPPSMGSIQHNERHRPNIAMFGFSNTLQELRVAMLDHHPLQVLENKWPQHNWSWSTVKFHYIGFGDSGEGLDCSMHVFCVVSFFFVE